MPKFLGNALDIPAGVTTVQAVRKGYVDSADTALAARIAALEAGGGGGGAFAGYRHEQITPATVWDVTHALGFDPAGLTVVSTDGDVMDGGAVQYLTPGQTLRLSFDISFAGFAYLS